MNRGLVLLLLGSLLLARVDGAELRGNRGDGIIYNNPYALLMGDDMDHGMSEPEDDMPDHNDSEADSPMSSGHGRATPADENFGYGDSHSEEFPKTHISSSEDVVGPGDDDDSSGDEFHDPMTPEEYAKAHGLSMKEVNDLFKQHVVEEDKENESHDTLSGEEYAEKKGLSEEDVDDLPRQHAMYDANFDSPKESESPKDGFDGYSSSEESGDDSGDDSESSGSSSDGDSPMPAPEVKGWPAKRGSEEPKGAVGKLNDEEPVPPEAQVPENPDDAVGPLNDPYGVGAVAEDPKAAKALKDLCPLAWPSRLCPKLVMEQDLFSNEYLENWITDNGITTEQTCFDLVENAINGLRADQEKTDKVSVARRKLNVSDDAKKGCWLVCMKRAPVFKDTFNHHCQYENDKWRMPSLSEMGIACMQKKFGKILGAKSDHAFDTAAFVGWDKARNSKSQITFAFEKESKSLSFLNFYRPIWFPNRLWSKEDMCKRNTKRCAAPFCSGSGKQFEPCVDPKWAFKSKNDDGPWTYCMMEDENSGKCMSQWLDSNSSPYGLVRTHACTHYQKPATAIDCVMDLPDKLSWKWTPEDKEETRMSMYRFFVQKAAKFCVMSYLPAKDVKCVHRSTKNKSTTNALHRFPRVQRELADRGIVSLQDQLSDEECNARYAWLSEDMVSCLNEKIGKDLGEEFFTKNMGSVNREERQQTAREVWNDALRSQNLNEDSTSEKHKARINEMIWLKYANDDVLDAIVDSFKYDNIFKEKERTEHFTHQGFGDYVMYTEESDDPFYARNRGMPMMGFLPDTLIHENSHSWEMTHRKCAPTLGMLTSMVAVVQKGIANTNNLHVHMVFPRPQSSCCDCKAAFPDDSGTKCNSVELDGVNYSCHDTQCPHEELRSLRPNSANYEERKVVLEAENKNRIANFRVNYMLGALAAQLNDYEAIGKWFANFKTRYLTVWNTKSVTELKKAIAYGGEPLSQIESKTGGHSWGTYKNAFTGFRAGIYGQSADSLIGFEFRSLGARMSPKMIKAMDKLSKAKDPKRPYEMVGLLQRVASILASMKTEYAEDGHLLAEDTIVKLNPAGVDLVDTSPKKIEEEVDEAEKEEDKEAQADKDAEDDAEDKDDQNDQDGEPSAEGADGAVEEMAERMSKPVTLGRLDAWQESDRKVGYEHMGILRSDPMYEKYCSVPAVVIFALENSELVNNKLEKHSGRALNAAEDRIRAIARRNDAESAIDSFYLRKNEEDGSYELRIDCNTDNKAILDTIKAISFPTEFGKKKKRRPTDTAKAGIILDETKGASIYNPPKSEANPEGCMFDPSTQRYYPKPMMHFLNKVLSDDPTIAKDCAQHDKDVKYLSTYLVANRDKTVEEAFVAVRQRHRDEKRNDDEMLSNDAVMYYQMCVADAMKRFSFTANNIKAMEELLVDTKKMAYSKWNYEFVLNKFYFNPFLNTCHADQRDGDDINLKEPAIDCPVGVQGEAKRKCQDKQVARLMKKSKLWTWGPVQSDGQCLRMFKTFLFIFDTMNRLEKHYEEL